MTCDTVDNYWRRYCDSDLTKVDMIILDVEGELDVFKGAQATLELSPNLIMMAECTSKLDEIEVLLRTNGFKFLSGIMPPQCLKKFLCNVGIFSLSVKT